MHTINTFIFAFLYQYAIKYAIIAYNVA